MLTIFLLSAVIGFITFPALVFASILIRKSSGWDDSNITNVYRLIGHMATHPSDFGVVQDDSGDKPFSYIEKKPRPLDESGN